MSHPLRWKSPRPLKAPPDHQGHGELFPNRLRKTNASVAYELHPKPVTPLTSITDLCHLLPKTMFSPCATSHAWQCRLSKMIFCLTSMHHSSAIRSANGT